MRKVVMLAIVLSLAACDPPAAESADAPAAKELTRRQKDSLISTMPLPGAGGVGRALKAADAAKARADALDAIR